MYKMCEKLKSDVALKYLSPGTDVLVDVADDDDVQVSMFAIASHTTQSMKCMLSAMHDGATSPCAD